MSASVLFPDDLFPGFDIVVSDAVAVLFEKRFVKLWNLVIILTSGGLASPVADMLRNQRAIESAAQSCLQIPSKSWVLCSPFAFCPGGHVSGKFTVCSVLFGHSVDSQGRLQMVSSVQSPERSVQMVLIHVLIE